MLLLLKTLCRAVTRFNSKRIQFFSKNLHIYFNLVFTYTCEYLTILYFITLILGDAIGFLFFLNTIILIDLH